MSRYPAVFVVLAGMAVRAVAAEEPPDFSKYDCTRTDDGRTVAGDKLKADGFEVMTRARFGSANLMLVQPKTSVRANCFLRTPAQK